MVKCSHVLYVLAEPGEWLDETGAKDRLGQTLKQFMKPRIGREAARPADRDRLKAAYVLTGKGTQLQIPQIPQQTRITAAVIYTYHLYVSSPCVVSRRSIM